MFSVHPFEPFEPMEEEEGEGAVGIQRLYRFPAGEDESDYFVDEQEENAPHDSDVDMMEMEDDGM